MYKLLISKQFDIMTAMHEKYIGLLRQYLFVGGMPEAVKEYVETGGLNAVRQIQQSILSGYARDFSKHAPSDQVPRIERVWQSIPSQLFKENKKFIYGALRKGARASEYETSIGWLADAGLI
jgi:predicted AAA+ superfamily ATPase